MNRNERLTASHTPTSESLGVVYITHSGQKILRDTEDAMRLVARVTDKINHCRAALVAVLAACFAVSAFDATASTTVPGEVTLHLEPLRAAVKEGEEIGMIAVFVGGAHETTLILPMGADPTGIITYRAIEVASGREWAATNSDPRSFAADVRQSLPAGGRLERHHHALQIDDPDNPIGGNLPAGTYRIVATYDEGRTFRPENNLIGRLAFTE